MNKKLKLTIELVPKTCWFSNLRSNLSVSDWTRLKVLTSNQAGYQCEICKGQGVNHPVECHEIWEPYTDVEGFDRTLPSVS